MPIQKKSHHRAECYKKWLGLTFSKEYREASLEIRRLQEAVTEADKHERRELEAYKPYMNGPYSIEKKVAQQRYYIAQEESKYMSGEFAEKVDETCKQFGLIQWWDPNDKSVTIDVADCIINSSLPVVVLDPPLGLRWDFNRDDDAPAKFTQADKHRWLTLKVNLNAPLPQVEKTIGRIIRINRGSPTKHRNRPDKVAEALDAFVCYQEIKNFSLVAKMLHRPVSTVKGQYVRGYTLVLKSRPAGRRKEHAKQLVLETIGDNPALEFQSHIASCHRCPNANRIEDYCPKWATYLTQDHVDLKEQLKEHLTVPVNDDSNDAFN